MKTVKIRETQAVSDLVRWRWNGAAWGFKRAKGGKVTLIMTDGTDFFKSAKVYRDEAQAHEAIMKVLGKAAEKYFCDLNLYARKGDKGV